MTEYIVSIDDLKAIVEGRDIKHDLKILIRCKDCKWHDTWACWESKSDNWFCPKGERKENEENQEESPIL